MQIKPILNRGGGLQSPQNESGSRDVILDPEQIDAFHRHGFVVVPQMSDAAEVAKLTRIFDRMFPARVGRSEGAQYDILGHDEDGVDDWNNRLGEV